MGDEPRSQPTSITGGKNTAAPDAWARDLGSGGLGQGAGVLAATAAAGAAGVLMLVCGESPDLTDAPGLRAQAETLCERLLALGRENGATYAPALAALRRARQAGARESGLAPLLLAAAAVTERIATASCDVVILGAAVAAGCDGDRHADVVGAVEVAQAACSVAAHLVESNLLLGTHDPVAKRVQAHLETAREAAARLRRSSPDR